MEIRDQRDEKEVIDYDFTFTSGFRMSLTVDASMGDYVTEDSEHYVLNLAAKPSPTNPLEQLPAEEIKVRREPIAVIILRKRMQRLPNAEELFDMQQTIQKLAKGVH